jgi:alkanesulfonate monooxygenase SsuD/methylene tetrahydromethanopterin reductase-like flavin-dependent oxidoreductase (luciferase family)
MEVIKDLAEGRAVDRDGTTVQLPWVHDGALPVWMAAYGPRALRVAGRQADGLNLQLADPYLVGSAAGEARRAASETGRDPTTLTVCAAAPAYIGSDPPHMRDELRWFGGMVGNHVADLVARYGSQSEAVPQALTDYIAARGRLRLPPPRAGGQPRYRVRPR